MENKSHKVISDQKLYLQNQDGHLRFKSKNSQENNMVEQFSKKKYTKEVKKFLKIQHINKMRSHGVIMKEFSISME